VKIKKIIIRLIWIVFSIALLAVGVNMFLGPHQIAAGGLTGLAIILEAWIGIDRSIIVYIGNGIVVIATLIFLGREIFINTIIGAGLLPFAIQLVPQYRLVEDTMLSMVVMGYIENGLNKKKRVHIISKHGDAITRDIMADLGKSVTVIPTRGSYDNVDMPMLMITMDAGDYRRLIEIVDRHDERAFVVTDVVSDVHGRGFTYGSGSV